jgi:hypothetical protein
MISEYAGDAVFGGLAVDLISRSQSQEPSQGFLVFIGNMNGCKMSASVKAGEHDSIESIGLASVTRFARDQRWSDHVAMEAVVGKDTLRDEACTGSFVARSDGSVLGETPEKLAHLHQIAGEIDNLSLLAVPVEDGCSNRLGMHVKADKSALDHGWTPFEEVECTHRSCSSG